MIDGPTAYARHRGVTHPAVLKAIKTGRIREAVLGNGKIDFDKADALWNRNSDPAAQHRDSQRNVTVPTPIRKPVPNVVDGESFQEARTRREIAAADTEEFERDRNKGLYVLKSDFRNGAQAMGQIYRSSLENLQTSIAPILVGKSLDEIEAILRDEFKKSLARTSDEITSRFGGLLENAPEDHVGARAV